MRRLIYLVFGIMVFLMPASALAQDYYFQNPQKTVHVYWNEDGTESLNYGLVFINDPAGHAIEFVDLALPNSNYDMGSITAQVDAYPVTYISSSEYQGEGDGIAFGLEGGSIPPGDSGVFTANIGRIEKVIYPDDNDENYVSAVFNPAYFISSVVYGTCDITVVFHLPPNVQPDEPRWHAAPSGFTDPPETGFDDQGRITYTWRNPNAEPDKSYSFGASFPAQYVPTDSITRKEAFSIRFDNINLEGLLPLCCIGFFGLFFVWMNSVERKRKLEYLPPKVTMEGQGIKRGLTAVEAAIILEQPLDKVMTMILFAVIKKNAARVVTRDPLELEIAKPEPEGLQTYEQAFLNAFRETGKNRQRELQTMIVDLVKTVTNKVRGFSVSETKNYYQNIILKAWQQVEAADTPEVRSQKYDEVMEWTMMDKDYGDRTRDVFRGQPVFVPVWWGGFDPVFRRTSGGMARPSSGGSIPSSSGAPSGGLSLPNLPGSDFAASVVNSVQAFSGGVIGNLREFTSGVTQKTNPVPVTRSSSSGGSRSGGSSCACACACAGCACACAGGGR